MLLYSSLEVNVEPVWYENHFASFLYFLFKIDTSEILNFGGFQYIVESNIILGILGEYVSPII